MAGVSNRDARAVYDVRARAMRELWRDGAADERELHVLGQLLLDALRLELWDARRLTSFAAFAEEVIGIQAGRAEALAEAAAARTGESATPLTERAIALWLRTEAGLYEGDEGARARVRTGEQGPVLEITVALSTASTALAGVGARHLPLARSRDERSRDDRDERDRDERPRDERDRDERPRDERDRDGLQEARPSKEPAVYDDAEAQVFEEPAEPAEPAVDFGSEADDEDSALGEVAPEPISGGVKLLTRKQAGAESRWGNREPSRGGDAPERGQERPRFNREERARDDRPRFNREDRARDDRPRFSRDERPRDERPRDERPRFNDRPRSNERARDERPRFNRDERPRDDRPRFNDRARSNEQARDERPRFNRDDRPRFGDRPRDDRPRFGDRPRDDRPRFNDRPRPGDDRPRFGGDRGGRAPVDRSQGKPGKPAQRDGKFGAKFGAKFAKPAQGKGFGARQQFGQKPQAGRPRDDDFDE